MPIKLPESSTNDQRNELEVPARAVVIGANGSGKTRFGIWLEQNNEDTHRISAQKALNVPDYAPMKTLEQAEKALYLGTDGDYASVARKIHDRWGSSPATFLLSDYDKLLALLFAKECQRDRIYTQAMRGTKTYTPVPDSVIDQIINVWSDIMPQRGISFGDGKIVVTEGAAAEYHAKEMSDGERVTLYLLGQCLSAPTGSILIIDEPELHLHRALMDKLWNTVEQLCPDKSLVYITHDLEFAASRAGAHKIWIQDFTGSDWTWIDVPGDDVLPEELVLEVLGSRKPVLFCEGDRGGLDHIFYQLCLPHLHVVPQGGAEAVIQTTKALRNNPSLHNFAVGGLVDRDVRSDEEIAALNASGVYVLPFAEVENVLCCEAVVRDVASQLALDPDDILEEVKSFVVRALHAELEHQIGLRAARRLRYRLSCYSPEKLDQTGLKAALDALIGAVDVAGEHNEARDVFAKAIESDSLDEVLRVYNRKSIASRISTCLGLKDGEYPDFVIRLLKGADGRRIASRTRSVLPDALQPSREESTGADAMAGDAA